MQGRIAEHLMNFAERLIEPGFGIEEATLFAGGSHSSIGGRSALMWRKLVLRSMSPSLSILRVRLVTKRVFRLAQVESDVPSVRYGASLLPPAQTAPPGRRICLGLAAFVAVRTGARAPLSSCAL
jgi:hypothetical protein